VDDDKAWTMAHGTFNQFKWIFVDQQKIEIRTINTDNADAVSPKTDADDQFSMPNNIDIWMPTLSGTPGGIVGYNNGVLTLTNPTNPTVDLGADIDIMAGTTATLDAGGNYDSYLWSDNSTSNTLVVSIAGTYSVTITDNGCTKTDEITVTVITNTHELDKEIYQFSLSPNPASDIIAANIIASEAADMKITIYDSSGKMIMERTVQISVGENEERFSLDDISNGIYLMVLEKDGATQVQKFMVVK